jgi:hypothetical protein
VVNCAANNKRLGLACFASVHGFYLKLQFFRRVDLLTSSMATLYFKNPADIVTVIAWLLCRKVVNDFTPPLFSKYLLLLDFHDFSDISNNTKKGPKN